MSVLDNISVKEVPMTTNEIVRAFFLGDAGQQECGEVRIDVLDGLTNSDTAAVGPTTICWADGRPGTA